MIINKLFPKRAFYFILLAFFIVSCQNTEPHYLTVKKDIYKIDIPEHMEESDKLNSEASLQYQNLFKELYIIILDEPKKDFNELISDDYYADKYSTDVKGYTDFVLDNYYYETEVTTTDPEAVKINGLDAFTHNMEERNTAGYDIFFKVAYIEGRNNYYRVMVWTLSEYKEEYRETMERMINSFKETDRSRRH